LQLKTASSLKCHLYHSLKKTTAKHTTPKKQ